MKEIRLRKGKLDDIAIHALHLEDMDGKNWWLGIYRNGKRTTFWIRSKTRITVEVQEDELNCKLIEQEKSTQVTK